MASSLVKIDIHLIFHVKSTSIPIQREDLPRIFQYIGGIVTNFGGIPIEVGGVCDHIHILTTLPKTMAVSDFVRTVKANSSKWISQLSDYYIPFCWQDGYGAFSVSPSLIEKTVNYIRNQEKHHQKTSFRDEYKTFLEHYGVEYDEQYAFED